MATNSCILPYCLIPLSSEESLWEWDIVSDCLFLSAGAIKTLRLDSMPRSMEKFYRYIPPAAASELSALRDGVITGKTGSVVQCGYLFNGLWINEFMMVITRNSEGMASRVMGRFMVGASPGGELEFADDNSGLGRIGVWIYNVGEGCIWQDRVCAQLMGDPNIRKYDINEKLSADNIHPAERERLQRHFKTFCEGRSLGDHIIDIVGNRNADGHYSTILIRATALERDADGRALMLAGTVTAGERQPMEKTPLGEDDRLFHALRNINAGQWNWDTRTDKVNFCPRFLAMLGYTPNAAGEFAQNWREQIHPDDYKKANAAFSAVVEHPDNGDSFECTYRMRRADGSWAWVFDRGMVAWRDASGIAGQVIGSITNITTAQLEREKLEDLVKHDTLTGLRSRAYCTLEIEHIEQNDIRPVCVISVDITGMKMVNDNLGHARGDELLTKAASILRGSLRRSDFISRNGGDEFLVLLPNCGKESGIKLLKKVDDSFASYNANPDVMPVFASTGMACAETLEETVNGAIRRADADMYKNKKLRRKHEHNVIRAWIKKIAGKEVNDIDDRVE